MAFRDYLRVHPDVAREYELLKVRLAKQFFQDREGYTQAKTVFVKEIVAEALK